MDSDLPNREWSDQDVREKLEQILSSKDRKAHHGNLYSKLILVIHTDEVELQSFRLFPILDATRFPPRRNIDEEYLICSYEPGLGYPYTRVNLDGPTTGPK